ncbi:MAG: hypothetical protein M3404_05120 [Actinomycetota bacterium]|nr:hypothetical protein [Actinomycetota bacterium]
MLHLKDVWRRNPAVIIGLIGSVATAVAQGVGEGLTWVALVPVVAGIITRSAVWSPMTVEEDLLDAETIVRTPNQRRVERRNLRQWERRGT